MEFDILIYPIKTLITCESKEKVKGDSLRTLPAINNGAVGIKDGLFNFVGKSSDLDSFKAELIIDAKDKLVLPGFVDPHTHIPFTGDRANEFKMKLEGKSYMEIAKEGGGILSTVKKVREIEEENFLKEAEVSASRILKNGVTSFEGKSGYGLDFENEIKQLRVLEKLKNKRKQKIVSTCLSAHFIPTEFKEKREKYIELILEEILPFVAKEKLAEYVDVFCEKGAFTVEESREIIKKGQSLGLKGRIHADEIENYGGTKLAAEIRCVCADHLLMADDEAIEMLSQNDVIPVLLPATAFFLRKPFAKARKFIEKGCALAIGSDLNPGSSYTYSIYMCLLLSVFGMGLFPEEAIWATTYNAASALSIEKEVGSIEVGKRADLNIFDVIDLIHLFYPFGESPLTTVICNGSIIS